MVSQASAARAQVQVSDGESGMAEGHQAAVVAAWRSERAPIALGKAAPRTGWRSRSRHTATERGSSALQAPRARQAPHVCPQQYSFGHSRPTLLCGTARVPFDYNSVTLARSLLAPHTRVNRRAEASGTRLWRTIAISRGSLTLLESRRASIRNWRRDRHGSGHEVRAADGVRDEARCREFQ
jgi:hypothetical protein